jgi:hypothetical protein
MEQVGLLRSRARRRDGGVPDPDEVRDNLRGYVAERGGVVPKRCWSWRERMSMSRRAARQQGVQRQYADISGRSITAISGSPRPTRKPGRVRPALRRRGLVANRPQCGCSGIRCSPDDRHAVALNLEIRPGDIVGVVALLEPVCRVCGRPQPVPAWREPSDVDVLVG